MSEGRLKTNENNNDRLPSTEFSSGDKLVIECDVAGSPKPNVTWLRDYKEIDIWSTEDTFVREVTIEHQYELS